MTEGTLKTIRPSGPAVSLLTGVATGVEPLSVGAYYRRLAGGTHSISNRGHAVHGLLAMTRGQLLRALWDAHALGSTATAARVERELLRRGQPRR